MRIRREDLAEVRDKLSDLQKRGDHLIAYCYDNRTEIRELVFPDSLKTFSDDFAATAYCYENSTDIDELELMDIATVCALIEHCQIDAFEGRSNTYGYDLCAMSHQLAFRKYCKNENELNNKDMHQDNRETVKKTLKFTGMDSVLDAQFDAQVAVGSKEFTAVYDPDYGENGKIEAFFRQSNENNYFFNKYELTINEGQPNQFKQTYYVNPPVQAIIQQKGQEPKLEWVNTTITTKEAWNLALGRFVLLDFTFKNKDGNIEAYKNWAKYDFKYMDKHGKYKFDKVKPYDLGAILKELPIVGIDMNELLASLYKGNRHAVMMEIGGEERRFFIQANPVNQTVTIGNSEMKIVSLKDVKLGNEQVADKKKRLGPKPQDGSATRSEAGPQS